MGGQHHQARLLLFEREDVAGGLGELAPGAHAGELAALQELGYAIAIYPTTALLAATEAAA